MESIRVERKEELSYLLDRRVEPNPTARISVHKTSYFGVHTCEGRHKASVCNSTFCI